MGGAVSSFCSLSSLRMAFLLGAARRLARAPRGLGLLLAQQQSRSASSHSEKTNQFVLEALKEVRFGLRD